ncbi:unnamed protein product [Medioppia subpectinata]|uniref:peptidylprolyl isomerase n=1 Tax=Medioppia subpectinata TaxID=1979941 RepID=A0A7R9Q576_9ACAR|nr:unnamed protein product [Medioppia subpectinata]CAG2113038.1 unnamed protein product [Medioppia subpectinata]
MSKSGSKPRDVFVFERVETLKANESKYIKPHRIHYKMNGKDLIWDCMKIHDSVAILVYNRTSKKLVFVRQLRPAIVFAQLCQTVILSVICCLIWTVVCDESEALEELKVEVLFKPEECSRKSAKGDMLSMHYKGTLEDGKEFDSSIPRGEPFKFQLGIGQVIKGWDQGLLDMCPTEKRKLTIPSHLGYGDAGAGDRIPPKATLVFEVECIAVEDGPTPVNVFKEIDANDDNQLSREEVSGYLKKQMPEAAKAGVKDLPDQDKLVEEIFQHEDQDKNGFISHEEFSGPKHDEL